MDADMGRPKLVIIGALGFLTSCSAGHPSCENEVLDTIANPAARLLAIVFKQM